jgi:hypothetical protein
MYCRVKLLSPAVSEVRAATNIALMMEAARTSETSVYNYFTRQYIPEDKSERHTRRRENLKSHKPPSVPTIPPFVNCVATRTTEFINNVKQINKNLCA